MAQRDETALCERCRSLVINYLDLPSLDTARATRVYRCQACDHLTWIHGTAPTPPVGQKQTEPQQQDATRQQQQLQPPSDDEKQ